MHYLSHMLRALGWHSAAHGPVLAALMQPGCGDPALTSRPLLCRSTWRWHGAWWLSAARTTWDTSCTSWAGTAPRMGRCSRRSRSRASAWRSARPRWRALGGRWSWTAPSRFSGATNTWQFSRQRPQAAAGRGRRQVALPVRRRPGALLDKDPGLPLVADGAKLLFRCHQLWAL